MKTAMQELWSILDDVEKNGVFEIGTQNFKRYIEGIYLEKEKQQIIDAVNHKITPQSVRNSFIKDVSLGEQYYNETFGEL